MNFSPARADIEARVLRATSGAVSSSAREFRESGKAHDGHVVAEAGYSGGARGVPREPLTRVSYKLMSPRGTPRI